ncbi:MAG: alpha/beta hydrolase [Bryobacterales bacterium]|nr:alpha/beta hydrolase [Bryobacterales bacterium]
MNILLLTLLAQAFGQQSAQDWATLVGQRFRAVRDVVYRSTPQGDLKVDLYVPYNKEPGPTMLYIHGGGWQTGSKEQYVLWYLPYLQLGMRVVAVEYRLSGRAPAPAAVEDARCAFLWLAKNGAQYGVDPNQIVITGGSAGGHLALMTAFLDDSMDKACGIPGPAPKARAVVDYYGATDLLPLVPEDKPHRSKWLSGPYDPVEMARRMSPLTWVRPGLPPVLMLHGDADKSVPYSDSVRLGEALSKVGVPNELVTVPGGAHGRHTWTDADILRGQRRIEAFLKNLGLVAR